MRAQLEDVARRAAGTVWRHRGIVFALVLIFVFYADRFLSATPAPSGDGYYSWIYARSLAFDGDLHLANDYALCGDEWYLAIDYGAGRPSNPFYFGPALVWTPLLWIAKHVVHLAPDAPALWRAGCAGPFTRFVGWSGPLLSIATLALGYRVARRWASPAASTAGVLVVGFGSPLIAYGTSGWFTSHVGSAFGVALALLLFVRAAEVPAARARAFYAGAALGLAVLMRPNELAWGAGPAFFVFAWMLRDARAKKLPIDATLFGLAFVLGVLSVVWIQLAVWKTLYGAWWVTPPGKLYLQPWHAHPFLLLFSSRSGLLVFTPLMWIGLLGLLVHGWRSDRPGLGWPLLVSTVAAIWICSSPLAWAGGNTISARLLTSLAAPFVATSALFVDRVSVWLRARKRRRRAALAIAVIPIFAIAWGIGKPGRVSPDHVVRGTELYPAALGASLEDASTYFGNPMNLPASLVFAARYRVRPKDFDTVAIDGIFKHDYKTGRLRGTDTVDFRDLPPAVVVAEGRATSDGFVATPASRVRFLITLAWPWVTDVRLRATAPRDATLRFLVNGFFTRMGADNIHVSSGTSTFSFGVPAWAFDSGINEVVIEASDDVTLAFMTLEDHVTRDAGIK